MRHSILALPALLRPVVLLASASQHSFGVSDDLYAFPQYEVRFHEEYLTELQAQTRLEEQQNSKNADPAGQLGQYQPYSDPGSDGSDDETKVEYTHMMLEGQQYLCSIPQVTTADQQDGAANETVSKADREVELARAADRGWELLRDMQGSCVYFISGWWSYRFCYNDGVRQFHQLPPSKGVPLYPPVEDPAVEGFVLGSYRPKEEGGEEEGRKDTGSGELVQRGESRYLVQNLEGGTTCDLTGKPRRVEVQYHCNPASADRISLIKEVSTCAYLMVVQTPRLCNDVAFLPAEKVQPNNIKCYPVLAEEQIDDYESDLKTLRSAEREARIWEAHTDAAKVFLGNVWDEYPTVGGIVVGGHNFVPDDVKLEKSAIVGGKGTYVNTVASSDGKTLSDEAIKKLGLGTPQDVKNLKAKLEKLADGDDWRLDVFDTVDGRREYRAIIGSDDENTGTAEDKTETKETAPEKQGQKQKKQGKPQEKLSKGKTAKKEGKPIGNKDKGKEEGSEEEYFYKDEL